MDAQLNRNHRRKSRRDKRKDTKTHVEPVIVQARRPDSPRLEKPTRRMKAASARPRSLDSVPPLAPVTVTTGAARSALDARAAEPKRAREARIVVRKEDAIDEREQNRRKLLHRFLVAEGRAQITRAADAYLAAGFALPIEQDSQLKLLEHFDEARAREAMTHLSQLLEKEEPRQLPVIRQRLRRLEDYADDADTRTAAATLRRTLPA